MHKVHGFAFAALLGLAAPATAQEEWIGTADGCGVHALNLKMHPAEQGNTMVFPAGATQALWAPGKGFNLFTTFQAEGASIRSHSDVVLPNYGRYTDGTVRAAVTIDGKPVAAKPEMPGGMLVSFSQANDDAFQAAVRRGKSMTLTLLNAGGAVLHTYTLDLTPLARARAAVAAKNWKC